MEKRPFTDFELCAPLREAIDGLGYELATPIQSATIPALLGGGDLVGQSPTGSGKTAAFGIPLLQRIDPDVRAVQALVLCPTRELAVQVAGELHKLGSRIPGLRVLPVYGGAPFHRQAHGLETGTQVVIGTPGRVLDHLRRGTLDLSQLRTAVLDEADEMLDMGFIEDIQSILEAAPSEQRQTVFFSATMPRGVRELIDRFARDPQTVTVESETFNAPDIEQVYYEVRFRSKPEVLSRLLDTHDAKLAIVFCNTKRNVDDLADALVARGYSADRLHGDVPQTMRTRVMNAFRNGAFEVLVATDVAARGLDVDDVDLVFNFDLPFDPEDYVHRIGRTGRAGRSGKAITFVSGRDVYKLQNIQRHTKKQIQRASIPTLDELEEKRHDLFYDQLHGLLEAGEFPKSTRTIDRLLAQEFSPTEITAAALHLLHGSTARSPEEIPEDRPPPPKRERDQNREKGKKPKPWQQDGAPGGDRAPRTGHEHDSAPGSGGSLFVNIGAKLRVTAGDIAGVLYNAAGLPHGSVGKIMVFPKHSIVNLPADLVETALTKLEGVKIRGKDVRFDHNRPERRNYTGNDHDERPAGRPWKPKPKGKGYPRQHSDDDGERRPSRFKPGPRQGAGKGQGKKRFDRPPKPTGRSPKPRKTLGKRPKFRS